MSYNPKEIVDFIIKEATIKTIKESFASIWVRTGIDEIVPIDTEFANCRLLKVKEDIINFEYPLFTKIGYSWEVAAQYWKDGRIFLPYEFYIEFIKAYSVSSLPDNNIFGFSMLNNALIAAFSHKALLYILTGADQKAIINGLDIELYLVEPGELNIYAHDRHGLNPNKALAVGNIKDEISVNPTITYKAEYDNLVNLKLLSIRKFQK